MNAELEENANALVNQQQEGQEENGDDIDVGDCVTDQPSREDFGKMLYGCEHYRRRCKLRAPCCNQVFTCRHCHNEATSALSNPKERHELVRPDVEQVICAGYNTEQKVNELCSNCGVKFGEYFCEICRFYDDDTTKRQFHCHDCGIWLVVAKTFFTALSVRGKRVQYRSLLMRANQQQLSVVKDLAIRGICVITTCVENSMKNHCPICYEFLFDSVKGTTIMKCGHTMHMDCYSEMINQNQYRCPICTKSVLNMSRTWERLDLEIEATAMPEEYQYEVPILSNDCNNTSKAYFHIFGHKCRLCNSYNTRIVASGENNQ